MKNVDPLNADAHRNQLRRTLRKILGMDAAFNRPGYTPFVLVEVNLPDEMLRLDAVVPLLALKAKFLPGTEGRSGL